MDFPHYKTAGEIVLTFSIGFVIEEPFHIFYDKAELFVI